jgi:hypothetical protein
MKPDEYERFVTAFCQELATTDGVDVLRGKEFIGRVSGRTIKVDASFEVSVLGSRVLVIVECKNYSNPVPVDDIEEFHSKLDDIGAHKGIVVTTTGFQDGALKVAKGRGIALAILRAETQSDELHYMVRSAVDNVTANSDPHSLIQGNFKPWGHLGQEENGFRFNSAPEMVRLLQVSMFNQVDWKRTQQ